MKFPGIFSLFISNLLSSGSLLKLIPSITIIKKLTKKGERLQKNKVTAHDAKKHDVDGLLINRLKELRAKLAKSQSVPAYVIFHDATLVEMSKYQPKTIEELMTINGVGQKKQQSTAKLF